jgi:hypothetical protein
LTPVAPETLDAIVAAMLTVNQYPVERAVALVPSLRNASLLDPAAVNPMTWEHLVLALRTAGYDRGGFVPIVAARLAELMLAAERGDLTAVQDAVDAKDSAAFCTRLSSIKGFGPKVSNTAAWLLGLT